MGWDAAIIERARSVALEFFRLPEEAKREAGTNRFHHGYLKPGSTQMYDGARLDLKESFTGASSSTADRGRIRDCIRRRAGTASPAPKRRRRIRSSGRTYGRPAMPALKAAVHPFFEAASACAEDLLRFSRSAPASMPNTSSGAATGP